MSENRLLLIDGHSILSRAFYGIPELTNSEGKHTNAVYGFLNILLKELELEEADHLAVAFDLPAPTFRHKLFPEYKGTRKAMPEELREQVPLMQELLSSMHIPILKKEGYEADDILGTIAKRMQKEGKEVVIVSGDRDLLQLADTRIKISLPKTSRGQTEILSYFPEDVRAEWKVSPEEFIDLKALMGDSSDNIPGVPGMGPKTAEWIIQHYHTIENAKEHALEEDFKVPRKPRAGQELLEHWDLARLSKTLATIFLEVPIDFDFRDARVENLFNEESLAMVRRLEFKSLVKRFDEGLLSKGEGEGTLSLPECRDVTDPYLCGIVFSDAENAASAGFFLAREEDEEVLYFALSKDRFYRFHGFPFGEKLNALSEKILLYTLSLKEQLSRTEISEKGNWQDLSLAAYLLNPLKDSYDYDDLSRDYLGLLLPSEKELGDSERPGKYRAFLSLLSGKKLLSRLDKKERELYREIELPLVFTLHEMEESGILVDREALLSYGAELREKIGEIRERIYRE
ncbi:MAG: 5'-3' exonuclease H3TH domain-containing protein, partial [Oribacterium sp.]